MEANSWAISKVNFKKVAKCQEYANSSNTGQNNVILFEYFHDTDGSTRTVDYVPNTNMTVHEYVSSPAFSVLMRAVTGLDCWCYTRWKPGRTVREVVMVVRSEWADMPPLVHS